MDLRIFIRGVEDDGRLREYAQEKIGEALQRYEEHILDATARLEDETGPNKSTVDKVCSIELKLRVGEIRIREVGEEFIAAIEVALDRLRAALSRQVSRVKRGIGEG